MKTVAPSSVPSLAAAQARLREMRERENRNGHESGVLWLTGLSGAGKSTLAFGLGEKLLAHGYQVYVLDGDNVRAGLNSDLGFSHADRIENIRRVGEMAALFEDAGMICISAFISPYRSDRETARRAARRFREVYVKADLATCERRDPKGLYREARAGRIRNFTGIDDVYEPPERAALVIDTVATTVDEALTALFDYVIEQFGELMHGDGR